ncbi:MAG TPA: phosphatidate cytidylyltransferase [Bacillota bacterium]|nr:phosphatidate cytidylyltransferase [Bacillota bacterium]
MKTRIITAVVALLLFVPIVLYGNWPFTLLVFAMATVGLHELLNIKKDVKSLLPTCISFLALWAFLCKNIEVFEQWIPLSFMQLLIIFVMLLCVLTVTSKNRISIESIGFYFIATMYITIGFSFLVQAREHGISFILFILFIIWATDSGAYFVGSSLGKHKLWPSISPNKTIEGAIGGTLIALLVGIIFHLVHPFEYSLWVIALISIGIAVVGQLGDLVASAMKRHFSVKDFGYVLPGHGGIMDRFDSLIFVLPFLYVVQFI